MALTYSGDMKISIDGGDFETVPGTVEAEPSKLGAWVTPALSMTKTIAYGPARTGKSFLMQEMIKAMSHDLVTGVLTKEMAGEQVKTVILDNLVRYTVDNLLTVSLERMPIETFNDPAWPLAKVEVFEEPLMPGEPRHPQRKGSPIPEFVIVASGRRSRPERNKRAALINARELHKRLVATLEMDAQRELEEARSAPNYARF